MHSTSTLFVAHKYTLGSNYCEEEIGFALWRLGTNVECRTISHLFDVGLPSACVIVHEVCNTIVDVLLPKYIKVPSRNQAMKVVSGFEDRWGFPQCFGAVDGSHISILPPVNNAKDYYNRKGALFDHDSGFG